MSEETYKCEVFGKIIKISDNDIPKCFNNDMKKIPLDICTQPQHAEHTRPMDDEDVCDDFRGG